MNRLKLTILLGSLAALAPLSTDMYLPALPLMHGEFNVEPSAIQLTLTMTMIGMAVGQIAAGPISDRFGRRMPLVIGMLAFALSTFGCMMSNSIIIFLIFRLLQGISGAFGIVIARAIARDVCQGADLTRFFAMLMLVNGLAPILAPVIGGQILLLTSWRGIFALLAIIGLMLLISSIRFNETLPDSMRAADVVSSFKNFGLLMKDNYFFGHCLMQCFFGAAFFTYISGSPFLFQNIYEVSPQVYSAIFGGIGAVIALTGALPARLAGRVQDIKMLIWTIIQAVIGSILFFCCVIYKAPIEFTLATLVITVPTISIFGATSFSLAMRKHGNMAGSASALIGFFSMISGGLMAPLVSIGGSHNALPMALIMLIGYLGTLITFITMIYSKHHRGYLFMKNS
ncbi:MAG: multidrug effflux MFS transporter [Selenomonadaceae bacterium]|nr:multidrug effflux MFS transporter [Selenomonadaceae bacterium]MBR1858831.1 multidrug effflux MFS transporter [Selenomonadaceae bacterium]